MSHVARRHPLVLVLAFTLAALPLPAWLGLPSGPSLPGTAHAAVGSVTRFGTTLARACYVAADTHQRSVEGLRMCDSALAEEPLNVSDRAATYVNRGILRVLTQDFDAAKADYDAALRLQPELGEAYVNRGLMYVRQPGKEQLAIDDITKGLALGTREPAVAHYGRALAFEAVGRVAEAYHELRKAAELAPTWTAPTNELARFTVTRGTDGGTATP